MEDLQQNTAREQIPEADMARIKPILAALEAAFRPLANKIPHDTQPALIHIVPSEDAR